MAAWPYARASQIQVAHMDHLSACRTHLIRRRPSGGRRDGNSGSFPLYHGGCELASCSDSSELSCKLLATADRRDRDRSSITHGGDSPLGRNPDSSGGQATRSHRGSSHFFDEQRKLTSMPDSKVTSVQVRKEEP